MKKQNIAPVTAYILTSEQLVSYKNEQTKTSQYTPIAYSILDNETIYAIGKTVGRNCMKKQYQLRGLEDYNPNNPNNWATLEDFQGNAILAIYEYCKANNLIGLELSEDTFTSEDMHELRLMGYKACNQEGRAIRQTVYKHLYIEQCTDEDGNPTFDIIDVTANIERQNDTYIWEAITPHTSVRDRKILKWIAQGYTHETISKRLGITRRAVSYAVHKAQERAQKGLESMGGE